jgi:hypothetical protein
MFVVLKRLPEPEHLGGSEGSEYNHHRIEFSVSTIMMENCGGQRPSPLFPVRPIQNRRSGPDLRKNLLLDMGLPNRTV